MKLKNINVTPTALLAELIGTFILALVAIAGGVPLVVGLTLAVLVLSIGSISGSHVNPAVTLGLWSIKKFEGAKVPFYLLMQFTGAIAALLVFQYFKGDGFGLSLASFSQFDGKLVVAEMLGAAVFLFAIAAAVEKKLTNGAQAACIGLALVAGLYIGGGLLSQAAQSSQSASLSPNAEAPKTERAAEVDGAVLNPAIAVAATEKEDQQSQLQALGGAKAESSDERAPSRLTLETLVGASVGGVLGAQIYMITAGVNILDKKSSKKSAAATVTKVVKSASSKKPSSKRKK